MSEGKQDRLLKLPTFMRLQILAFFGYRDYSLTMNVCKYLKKHWYEEMKRNRLPLHVPLDCSTLNKAISIAGPIHVPVENEDDLSVGTIVYARYVSMGTFYNGHISKINFESDHGDDDQTVEKKPKTFDILFNDGDVREKTPIEEIMVLEQWNNNYDDHSSHSSNSSSSNNKNTRTVGASKFCCNFPRRIKGPIINKIIIGRGTHRVDKDIGQRKECYLHINSPNMIISGDPNVPKEDIIIDGGIYVNQTGVQISNISIGHRHGTAIYGEKSYALNNVTVLKSDFGIGAGGGHVIATCNNVEVKYCTSSGVVALNNGTIVLMGLKTIVHRCFFGLDLFGGVSSKILLVSPLTKETVSINNVSGNWTARAKLELIKNVEFEEIQNLN
jgi:hypothetical protein